MKEADIMIVYGIFIPSIIIPDLLTDNKMDKTKQRGIAAHL